MSFISRLSLNSVLALSALMLISSAQAQAPSDFVPMDETIPEGAEVAPPLTEAEKEELAQFVEPSDEEVQAFEFAGRAGAIDPNHEVPAALLNRALAFYEKNQSHIKNGKYLTVVNFSRFSGHGRMYIINMSSGEVTSLHVAHGIGSDRENTGVAHHFSNKTGSNMSSLGFYRTAETYNGIHGLSLRLDGLSDTNSNVRNRDIVIHGANYVYDEETKAGRSAGCLAVSMANHSRVVNMLKEGSIIYAGTAD